MIYSGKLFWTVYKNGLNNHITTIKKKNLKMSKLMNFTLVNFKKDFFKILSYIVLHNCIVFYYVYQFSYSK